MSQENVKFAHSQEEKGNTDCIAAAFPFTVLNLEVTQLLCIMEPLPMCDVKVPFGPIGAMNSNQSVTFQYVDPSHAQE